ncbi:MAG: DUF4167 domain-containing protein [Kaiparowitsia implicata GSE-PSE-MK54-09C]|nr:DUF4167 domain-containing protein [Kaiparowitsia implicata GSE-PSE-MK54-09C]
MRTSNGPASRHEPPAIDRNTAVARQQHYLRLADAQVRAGDRVAAENYFQHAEHFLRCAIEGTR